MINAVRQKAREKREQLEAQMPTDPQKLKAIEIIEDLLSDRCCFLQFDVQMACQILRFIGYSLDEISDIYPKLVRKAWTGEYTLIDPPGIIVKSDDLYGDK